MIINLMVNNITAVWQLASPYEINEGADWYRGDAGLFVRNLGWQVAAHHNQITAEISDRHWSKFAAAVCAVLSPQKEWRVNKALTDAVINQLLAGQELSGHYPVQLAKVHKLYKYFLINRGVAFNQNDVLNIISKSDAKKTKNFYLNIIGDDQVVTVDGHAQAIAEFGTHRVSISDVKQPSGQKYDDVAEAYRIVALRLGIAPAVLQATTWVTYRRLAIVSK